MSDSPPRIEAARPPPDVNQIRSLERPSTTTIPYVTSFVSELAVSNMFLKAGRVGGAEFMVYGLLEGLLARGASLTVYSPKGERLDSAFVGRASTAIAQNRLKLREVALRGNRFVTEALDIPRLARRAGARSIVFPNYFTPPSAGGLQTLTAILDLQYLHFPEFFSLQKRLWLRAAHELTLHRATHVTVISEFVRNDILERYGQRFESKVTTVPIGISWERFCSPEKPQGLGGRTAPFLLSVASHYSHKNLATLLRAFARIAKDIPHDLVLVGQQRSNLIGVQNGTGVDLDELARTLGVASRVIVTGHVADDAVSWCYQHADLFVFPSLFEGFGMPAVEALGLGVPVITTRCGALPDVTRGLAHLVHDPHDVDELADVVQSALTNPDRFRPAQQDIDELRAHYDTGRIAQLYLDLLAR